MWYICVTVPVFEGTGYRYCFSIPVLVEPRLRPRPDPRWLVVDERPFERAQDLQVLATIAHLSRDLSPDFGRTLSAGIEQAFHSLKKQLPKGVELNFHEETQTAE
jgi:hypothetical protein